LCVRRLRVKAGTGTFSRKKGACPHSEGLSPFRGTGQTIHRKVLGFDISFFLCYKPFENINPLSKGGKMKAKIALFTLMILFLTSLSFSQAIDFIAEARKAKWFNDQGIKLPFPGVATDSRGFARLRAAQLEDGQPYTQILQTHPRWAANGGIEGLYPLTIPKNSSFEAVVGFIQGAKGSDGVIFEVSWREKNKENVLKRLEKTYSGSLSSIRLDLTSYGGHSGIIILRVKAGKSSGQDWAAWISAKIAPSLPPVTVPTKVIGKPAAQPIPIPMAKIEEATKRLALYTLKIECFPPGLKFEGVVDEQKESLYFQLGLIREKKLRPADFYWVGGKGYGRPVGIPSWVRIKVGKRFPKYLKAMTELLKQGRIVSVTKEGELLKYEIQFDFILPRDNPQKFFRPLLTEYKVFKEEQLRRAIEMARALKISAFIWVGQKDRQIRELLVESEIPQAKLTMKATINPPQVRVPPLPAEALKATGAELSLSMLLFHIPDLWGIGGWSGQTHCRLALGAIQFLKNNDSGRRYREIYEFKEKYSCFDASGHFIGPNSNQHPILSGAGIEDAEDRPEFYNAWLGPNPDLFFKNDYKRSYHHFGGSDRGLTDRWYFVFWPPVPSRFYSARDWGYGRVDDDDNYNGMTFIQAIKEYNEYSAGGKQNAYLLLGHELHLLQDQAEPDHSKLVPHPGSGYTEEEAYDMMYVCEILGAEAAVIAFAAAAAACGPFWWICGPVAAGVAFAAAYGICEDSISASVKGYERVVEDSWRPSRIDSRLRGATILTEPDYYSYFRNIAEFSSRQVEEFGLSSDYDDGNSLGCGLLPIIPPVPGCDPDIEPHQQDPYLRLTDEVATQAIRLGAGFLGYFYEIVNHPPYVKRVTVAYGGSGLLPISYERGSTSPDDIRYDAYWIDRRESGGMKREFQVVRDLPLDPARQAQIYIELGPQIPPANGKTARTIELTLGGNPISLREGETSDGKPYYFGIIPQTICTDTERTYDIVIRAWDNSAHLASRTPSGEEIDANPATVALVDTDSDSFPLINYEPGPDTRHHLRIAPALYSIAVSLDSRPIPPATTPPWPMPDIRITKPASGIKKDFVFLKAFSPSLTEGPPRLVTVYVPTACPVHWEADLMVDGPEGRGSSLDFYNFQLNLANPDNWMTTLEIITNPSSRSGRFLVRINYRVGERSGSIAFPIVITE